MNSKTFVFPAFEFSDFNIRCPDGYNTLGYIDKTCDFDTNLQSQLKTFLKLSHRALHGGNNKQNVSLALSIFDQTTVTASSCYLPDPHDTSGFLEIFQTCWTIANSK